MPAVMRRMFGAVDTLMKLWKDEKVTALRNALSVPFSELERYSAYVIDQTRFATHQGVKGLEFPRVMAIMLSAA